MIGAQNDSAILAALGAPKRPRQVADELGLPVWAVKSRLLALLDRGMVHRRRAQVRGAGYYWARVSVPIGGEAVPRTNTTRLAARPRKRPGLTEADLSQPWRWAGACDHCVPTVHWCWRADILPSRQVCPVCSHVGLRRVSTREILRGYILEADHG